MTPLEFLSLIGQIYAIENPIGVIGYLGEVAAERPKEIGRILRLTGIAVISLAAVFAVGGEYILSAFGVNVTSFRIAGGVIILATSIITLIHGSPISRAGERVEESAVVPLATPLIVGPGTITTLILFSHAYGPLATLAAALIASILSAATLYLGIRAMSLVGATPVRLVGRFMALIIATIGVEMILGGVSSYVESLRGLLSS
ncbi:MAG: MarC family protein [Thermoproteus sp. AZ2]|uniref:MarC family protein n=1 Tax=Thermoproteus sp. AZ2 TaxID=1609232 RepID=A0ACC6V2B1_9CREN|nr:MAG: antibiotic resistance protein MarC [Thermoproteus sp. AZ2]